MVIIGGQKRVMVYGVRLLMSSSLKGYRNKSQVNIKPSSFTFHPLQSTLIYSTEDTKREKFSSRWSVVAYLSVDFLPTVVENEEYKSAMYS